MIVRTPFTDCVGLSVVSGRWWFYPSLTCVLHYVKCCAVIRAAVASCRLFNDHFAATQFKDRGQLCSSNRNISSFLTVYLLFKSGFVAC